MKKNSIKKEARGRKRKYANNAERQRAYRERLKANGYRTVTAVVKDVRKGSELTSEIIDLSEVKKW